MFLSVPLSKGSRNFSWIWGEIICVIVVLNIVGTSSMSEKKGKRNPCYPPRLHYPSLRPPRFRTPSCRPPRLPFPSCRPPRLSLSYSPQGKQLDFKGNNFHDHPFVDIQNLNTYCWHQNFAYMVSQKSTSHVRVFCSVSDFLFRFSSFNLDFNKMLY